jgi:hypothetical protein
MIAPHWPVDDREHSYHFAGAVLCRGVRIWCDSSVRYSLGILSSCFEWLQLIGW